MLDNYRDLAPPHVLEDIRRLAVALKGRSLQHVNSTARGGGVAEILQRLVPLTESLGVGVRWDVLQSPPEFFDVTKAFHNALQGNDQEVSDAQFQTYLAAVRDNASRILPAADVVLVHDAQPAYLVDFWRPGSARLAWRCHIDVSRPNPRVWRFLQHALRQYHAAVFHIPQFAQDLPIPQFIVPPSIDPLSEKNRELTEEEITAVTDRFGLDRGRPIALQVSRFDRFKDPLGVIAAYRMVRQTFDCQLVLAGGTASDDPEGAEVLTEVRAQAGPDPDIFVLELPPDAHLEINALQRAATVVIQKSTREGFGLTVSEALWKGKPVIAGDVGGIPEQVVHGDNGFLVQSIEGAAFRLRYLLAHPRAAQRMGARGREMVRRNFLITRHLRDHLLLALTCLHAQPRQPLRLSASGVHPAAG